MKEILQITPNELNKFISPPHLKSRTAKKAPKLKSVVFLSTSFRRLPQVSVQTQELQNVFRTRFEIRSGWEITGGGQLAKIVRGIRDADCMVAEITQLVPNVMIEIGIAFGLKRRTYLLFNTQATGKAIRTLPDYVRSLDIVGYSFETDSMKQARDKIYERLQTDPELGECMEINIRGSTLRPKSDPKAVFVYHPRDRQIWQAISDDLRDALEKAGYNLVSNLAAPSGSTLLEEVMYGISRASRKLRFACFIDTSGSQHPDLAGSFALGVAIALGKPVERMAEADADQPDEISLWTEHTFHWHDKKELIDHILQSLKPSMAKQRRKR